MALKYWSIGPIKGLYQPESFTESQEMNVTDQDPIGNVVLIGFKSWKPREISISFVVYGAAYSGRPKEERGVENYWTRPEAVWQVVMRMVRPRVSGNNQTGLPQPVDIVLPEWGEGRQQPQKAIAVNASINRTHIDKDGAALRATISVTLRELALGDKQDIQQSIEDFQYAEDAEDAEIVPGETPP